MKAVFGVGECGGETRAILPIYALACNTRFRGDGAIGARSCAQKSARFLMSADETLARKRISCCFCLLIAVREN